MLYCVGSVVNLGNCGSHHSKQRTNCKAQHNREEQQLSVLIHSTLKFACAKKLTYNYGNGSAHGEEAAEEQVRYSCRDIDRGNHFKTSGRIALVQHSAAHRPKHLVKQQRQASNYYLLCKRQGDFERAVELRDLLFALKNEE